MSSHPYRSIALSLIYKIYLWATLSAVLVAGVQAWYSVHHVQEEFEAEVREIAEVNLPLLSVSIWDIEPQAIQRQLDSLVKRQQIGFVRVTAGTGQRFSAGDEALLSRGIVRSFPVPSPLRGGAPIGQVDIAENPEAMWRELRLSVGISVVSYGLLTFIICLVVGVILRRQLERPLTRIASFVADLSPATLTRPLLLDRGEERPKDEIDLVADGFRVLQEEIHEHISNLDRLVEQRTNQLEDALESIRRLSALDPLTGLLNRRAFDERMGQEIGRAVRYDRPLSVVFCDVDHFKSVNDTYGHAVGDDVLRAVANCLKDGLRGEIDCVARFGGEEFVILLPESTAEEAVEVAERMRKAVENLQPSSTSQKVRITASFGIAVRRTDEPSGQLIGRADAQLYLAKQSGRNRTCVDLEVLAA